MKAEYGSACGIRFLNSENACMYDSNGEVVLCKCGKPAGSAAMGREAFAAWCTDCSPLHKESAELVCRSVTNEQLNKFDGILNPDWIVNLVPTKDSQCNS